MYVSDLQKRVVLLNNKLIELEKRFNIQTGLTSQNALQDLGEEEDEEESEMDDGPVSSSSSATASVVIDNSADKIAAAALAANAGLAAAPLSSTLATGSSGTTAGAGSSSTIPTALLGILRASPLITRAGAGGAGAGPSSAGSGVAGANVGAGTNSSMHLLPQLREALLIASSSSSSTSAANASSTSSSLGLSGAIPPMALPKSGSSSETSSSTFSSSASSSSSTDVDKYPIKASYNDSAVSFMLPSGSLTMEALQSGIVAAFGATGLPDKYAIRSFDDEGDIFAVRTNEDLAEAWGFAVKAAVKNEIVAQVSSGKSPSTSAMNAKEGAGSKRKKPSQTTPTEAGDASVILKIWISKD